MLIVALFVTLFGVAPGGAMPPPAMEVTPLPEVEAAPIQPPAPPAPAPE